ncbi:MAG TPA: pyridoxine 5'-phosphate synthase [Lentisphaeria bacterium]|nr:MAG: pyridoxine 5'-phosphate synthase [Lentisphaerae bacterium GWF2_49_21]HBC89573.1 pyridoxine 5'-phosphate synthase [Lentisphaeria bacterium]
MLKLGVNIDHVATLRQARKAVFPDPVEAALICQKAGAHGITAHLREDRRHIQDSDMKKLAAKVRRLNMEMAVTDEMLLIAARLKPHSCCLVPEKRQELTTEGGLDVIGGFKKIKPAVKKLQKAGIVVSLFIDPDKDQIEASRECGAEFIELHTGSFAESRGRKTEKELKRLVDAAEFADKIGINVNAGHGIDYENIEGILRIPHLRELNIGHSIVSRAVLDGMHEAVSEMLKLMRRYRC